MPMTPHKGEDQSEFMSRCVPEMMKVGGRKNEQAVAICLDIWRRKDKSVDEVVRKETSAPVGPNFEYILSDASVDRYGDIIDPNGWQLEDFKRNPIALFNHDKNFPIGIWENVRIAGGKLVGRLKLAAKGTSARIDELAELVEQRVLKATSVGFRPIECEPRENGRGILF